MRKIHVLTLFPEMVKNALGTGILGRAQEKGLLGLACVDIRDYTAEKHGKVDDYPYGGGAGMLMQAQPVVDAWRAVTGGRKVRTVYLTPQGEPFTQRIARELSREEELVFLCGHYEGVDERALEEVVTDYVSIGDYVLTGGELAAMVMIDAITRLVPGVLHNQESPETESFHKNLLEYPQYSRPEVWEGRAVPEVLLSGNHKEIARWRLCQAKERTRKRRPDLYARYEREEMLERWLQKDKKSHADMLEVLRRGTAQLLYPLEGNAVRSAVAIRDEKSGTCIFTALSEAEGRKMLDMLEERIPMPGQSDTLFAFHEDFLVREMRARYPDAIEGVVECVQMVYTRGVPLKPLRHVEIRRLDMSYAERVADRYSGYAGADYVRQRLEAGAIFGAFRDGELAGFIGTHTEGSMGLLEVWEKHRRQRVAEALEGYLINRLLLEGQTPYCNVVEGNDASMRLQKKLGLCPAKGKSYWLL